MFDIGWPELLVVAIVLIVVVGPKDLPAMLRAFGRTTSKLRQMAGEFRGQFDEALREAELDDVRKTISDAKSLNPMNQIRDAVNPLKKAGEDIKADLKKAVDVDPKSDAAASSTAAGTSEPVKPMSLPEQTMKLSGDGPRIDPPASAKKAVPETKPAGDGAKPAAKTVSRTPTRKAGKAAPAPKAQNGGNAGSAPKAAAKTKAKAASAGAAKAAKATKAKPAGGGRKPATGRTASKKGEA